MITVIAILAGLLVGILVGGYIYINALRERLETRIFTQTELGKLYIELKYEAIAREKESHQTMLALINRWLRGPAESVDLNEPLDALTEETENFTPEQLAKMDARELQRQLNRQVKAGASPFAGTGPGARRFALAAELKRRERDAERERPPASRVQPPRPIAPGEGDYEIEEIDESLNSEDVSHLKQTG